MLVRSFAKINWSLRVTGRRSDGYHDLETLFQTISLHDVLDFRPSERLGLTCSDPGIPVDDSNLVERAARALGAPAVSIHIDKQIPAGGGLGGGSSNAAATLLTLNRMFGLRTPMARLEEMALALGSDVPFFLVGGTAFATGRGEVLTPLKSPGPIPLLLALPQQRVMTADAFRELRHFSMPIGLERYRAMLGDGLLGHGADLVNDFEEPVFARLPELRLLKRRMLECGAAWAAMSGSGSTIVGAFRRADERDDAQARFGGSVRLVAAECVDPIART